MIRKMPLQPLHAAAISGQAVLTEQVLANAQNIRSIKKGLMFRGNKIQGGSTLKPLLDRDLVEVARLIGFVGKSRPRRLLPPEPQILIEVTLHEVVIREKLPVSAAKRHRSTQDFFSHRQQNIARRHAAKHGPGRKVRRIHRLIPLDRFRTIDPYATAFEQVNQVIQLGVRTFHCSQGAGAPHAPHITVFRHLGFRSGLRRRDTGEIRTPHNRMLQWIKVIP